MDRNQLVGLLLIFLLLTVYFQFFAPDPAQEQTTTENKTKAAQTKTDKVENKLQDNAQLPDSVKKAKLAEQLGSFASFAQGESKTVVLENDLLKVSFNSQGGKIEEVILKGYKDVSQKNALTLLNKQSSQMAMLLNNSEGKSVDLYQLYFEIKQADKEQVVFRLPVGDGQYIEQRYTLKPKSYQVEYDLQVVGLESTFSSKTPARFTWLNNLINTEPDVAQTRLKTTVNTYTADGAFDYLTETSLDPEEMKEAKPLHWVSFKQKFFTSAIIAKNKNFSSGLVQQETDQAKQDVVKTVSALLDIPVQDLNKGKGSFSFFFGPNRYYLLYDVADGFYKNLDLGWPVVNLFTRFVVIPLFYALEKVIASYGIIIILLSLIIKMLIFPLAYRSYISMAKMKVLKPELDEIKARTGDDMQAYNQEQMKLFGQVGVNPLSGCIPLLLQLPVLFAMFTFFPNAIELRQERFLWAHDLSVYDSIATLPFAIPFYGNHVSLFTILMTISTLVLTYYNNQNAPNMQDSMKYMGYTMPVVFMFVLNTFPAGLNFYYLLSNVISVVQQIIIRNFVNEDQIRAILEKNKAKNKNKKKSAFMQKLEDALKYQEEQKAKKEAEAAAKKKPGGNAPPPSNGKSKK
ncbi:MAG TPA: membrane protein insertase YidC [Microscillaceae bacterium]|jgi:YidC/Oxa1 family membrane protein insertase|nr:membrane protein insertase YidC [Microscillaceae bacterium]